MFVQNLRRRVAGRLSGESEAGFTLVELLVVMLILGLLAAIAIPSFFNQTDKADDAAAKSIARNAQTAMETYRTDNAGSYAGADGTKLHNIEPTVPDSVIVDYTLPGTEYKVTAASSTGTTFSLSRNTDGTVSSSCSDPGNGGCPSGAGAWAG